MKPYITFCYIIKHGDIRLFCLAMRKIYIIFEVSTAYKSKYTSAMMRQFQIINIKSADPIL